MIGIGREALLQNRHPGGYADDPDLALDTRSQGAACDPLRTFAEVASDVGYGGGSGAVNVSHVINRS